MLRTGLLAALAVLATAASAAEPKVINEKAAFPEGPAFIDGKLHYVEYGGNTILVWDGSTKTKLWEQAGCGPSAVLPLGVTEFKVSTVLAFDVGVFAAVWGALGGLCAQVVGLDEERGSGERGE